MNMKLLEVRPLHVFLVFIATFVNNVALTSPQRAKSKGPPNFASVPETSFSCLGRTAGYYADPEAQCQAYHMCDTLEKQFSYLCPSYTLFNQKYMVCDHWHSVNCSAAIYYYKLNEEIGKVPDKENNVENVIDDQRAEIARTLKKKNDRKSTSNAHTFLKSEKVDNHSTRKESSFQSSFASRTTTQAPTTSILPTHFRRFQPKFEERVDSRSTHRDSKPSVRSSPSSEPTTQKPTTSTLPLQFRQPKQNFQLPKTFNESFHLPTHLEIPRPVFQTTTEQSPTLLDLPTISSLHFTPTTSNSIFFSHSLQDTNNFHVNPRGSEKRIRFDRISDNDLHSHVVNGIKFRPLFEKKQNPFIDKRNFTVPPNIFDVTPVPPLDDVNDDNDFDYDEENELEARSSPREPIITFLIPPTVESHEDRPFGRLNIPSLTTFLVPPPEGPVILKSDHQEIRTPLILSKIFRSFGIIPPQSEITPPRFSFTRPNRQFFIPSPGLQPPLNDNSISEEEENFHEHFGEHKMTMTFPNRTTIRRPLQINPRCPRCHPAFLKPNQCQPCVIIK